MISRKASISLTKRLRQTLPSRLSGTGRRSLQPVRGRARRPGVLTRPTTPPALPSPASLHGLVGAGRGIGRWRQGRRGPGRVPRLARTLAARAPDPAAGTLVGRARNTHPPPATAPSARLEDADALAALFTAVDASEGLERCSARRAPGDSSAYRGLDRRRDTLGRPRHRRRDPGLRLDLGQTGRRRGPGDHLDRAHPAAHRAGALPARLGGGGRPALPGMAGSPDAATSASTSRSIASADAAWRKRRLPARAHLRRDVETPHRGPSRPASLPLGIESVPWSGDLAEGARLATNEAFASHWDSMPATPEDWQARVCDDPNFRPDLSRLALSNGRVVALTTASWTRKHNARHEVAEVWVERVGTVPAYQRRGLATSLVGEVLRAAAAAGLTRAGLAVDQDKRHSGDPMYERLGFAPPAAPWLTSRTWIEGRPPLPGRRPPRCRLHGRFRPGALPLRPPAPPATTAIVAPTTTTSPGSATADGEAARRSGLLAAIVLFPRTCPPPTLSPAGPPTAGSGRPGPASLPGWSRATRPTT